MRVDNQALSWLKTNSMDQVMIGRWIARLDQYHFKTIHRHADARSTEMQMAFARGPMIMYIERKSWKHNPK